MVGTRLARPGHTWFFTCRMLENADGGGGVTFNDVTDVTKDVTFYTTTSRFVV